MAFLMALTDSFEGKISDQDYEIVFTFLFTQKISEEEISTVRLRYIPQYIWELKNKKYYWEEEYQKYLDRTSQENWLSYEKKLKYEIKKHKKILKNIDIVRRKFVVSDDDNHFSESIDTLRVQRIVDYLKENQSDDEIFYKLTTQMRGQKNEFDHLFYLIYAIWALYGEFRIRPSRRSSGVECH